MVVLAPELVGQPEVHHFRKVKRLEGVDVDVLSLVEDQLAGDRELGQAVRQCFDVAGFDVCIV